MIRDMMSLSCTIVTIITLVRFFPCMNSSVDYDTFISGSTVITVPTVERFFARMHSSVEQYLVK